MLTINTFPEYQFALKLRLVVFNAAMSQNEKAVEDFRVLNEAMEAYERKIYLAYVPTCLDCDIPPFRGNGRNEAMGDNCADGEQTLRA
jgi:hypothetical protein